MSAFYISELETELVRPLAQGFEANISIYRSDAGEVELFFYDPTGQSEVEGSAWFDLEGALVDLRAFPVGELSEAAIKVAEARLLSLVDQALEGESIPDLGRLCVLARAVRAHEEIALVRDGDMGARERRRTSRAVDRALDRLPASMLSLAAQLGISVGLSVSRSPA